jgi:hypothetical protein
MTSEERYKNGKIYTIRYRGDDSLIYVGSTCLPLYKRWYKHKQTCLNENNNRHNLKLYQKIRETNDFENWYIELYEEFSCENKEQLLKREGAIIREIGTLNSIIAGRTSEEWRSDNKDHLKEYREQNKESINEYKKQYKQDNKEKIKEQSKHYYDKNKESINEKTKHYRQENKEKIKDKNKTYYDKNKEKIHEKIICECGCVTTKCHMKRHQQTKKHLDLINSNSNENNENL